MTSHTETIIAALRVLARDIQSNDGIANAAIAEAADRLEEQQERIKRLKEAGDNGRPMLLLQSPGGRRWHFKLNAGAWVKESSAVEAQKEAA